MIRTSQSDVVIVTSIESVAANAQVEVSHPTWMKYARSSLLRVLRKRSIFSWASIVRRLGL